MHSRVYVSKRKKGSVYRDKDERVPLSLYLCFVAMSCDNQIMSLAGEFVQTVHGKDITKLDFVNSFADLLSAVI